METVSEVLNNQGERLSIFGDWLLVSDTMFVEYENGVKEFYTNNSRLRLDGVRFDIENIEAGETTWSFVEVGDGEYEFWLNKDSLNPYSLILTRNHISIIEYAYSTEEKMGGSARPLVGYTEDYDLGLISFFVQESYGSVNGVNCKYVSKLVFKRI